LVTALSAFVLLILSTLILTTLSLNCLEELLLPSDEEELLLLLNLARLGLLQSLA
jgi:hypothetical protein